MENKIYVLSYDGVVTGSQELRCYNADIVSKQYLNYNPSKETNKLIYYYNQYDNKPGGKKDEPFFDGFLAHMAFINPDKQDNLESINYYRVNYEDDVEDNLGKKSSLRTTAIQSPTPSFRKQTGYHNGRHIFLLAPTTKKVYKEINKEISDVLNKVREAHEAGDNEKAAVLAVGKSEIEAEEAAKKKEDAELAKIKPLFIHIQGEAINSNLPGVPRDSGGCSDTGMTASGGGMFGEAFNLFSGGIQIQKLRNLFEKNGEIYSVKPNCKNDTVTLPSSETSIKKLNNSFPYKVPEYYVHANDDILALSDTKYGNHLQYKFHNLNVEKVYQDITDKDNLASLAIIGRFSSNKIKLSLIGLRLYSSSTIPFGPPTAPKSTLDFRSWREKPSTGEYEKPGDIRNNEENKKYGNIRYQKDGTLDFYKKSTKGFMDYITDLIQNKYVRDKKEEDPSLSNENADSFIADGTGEESESLRCPFNMALFFFAPDTYQSESVGSNNGKQLKGINIDIGGIDSEPFQIRGGKKKTKNNRKLKGKKSRKKK